MLITQCKLLHHSDSSKETIRWVHTKNLCVGALVKLHDDMWIVKELYATMESSSVHDSHDSRPSDRIEGCF